MQSRDWTGAFRNLRAVATQMDRVSQAGFFHGLSDPVAISLLLLPGFRRRQHQICGARTAESFGERSRVAQISRERCSRPESRPTTRTFWPADSRALAMIEPVFPLAPKITYISFETTDDVIVTTSLVS